MTFMNPPLTYSHPIPWQFQVQRAVAVGILALGVVAAALLLLVAVLLPAPLFAIMALMVALLMAPVLWLLFGTPPVTLTEEGLIVHEFPGRQRKIAWEAIESVQLYPLLPTEQNEVMRRLLQGRKQYRPAEGIMLLIPSLSWPYRIGGFFAGQGFRPIIALTSRTHEHYAELNRTIIQTIPHVVINEEEPTP